MLNLRIVCVDYYMSPPTRGFDVTYSSFRIANVKQVPVIRIFGITPDGVKACIHIHGVFPYIYVPYDGSCNPHSIMAKIAQDIDFGINSSGPGNDHGPSTRHHVFKISLVSGIPFYGFHSKSHQFFKIYFYNPFSIKKAVGLLEDGLLSGLKLQPHEAHIPYILQFFIDYNLYGMSFMKLSSFRMRQEAQIPNEELRNTQNLYKISYCEIEGDAVAECILNKISPQDREAAENPGLAAIWEEEKARRLKEGKDLDSLIQHTQTNHDSQPTPSDLAFRQQLCRAIEERLEREGVESSQIGYAAETPEWSNLQDASFRDHHNITENPGQDIPIESSIFDAEDLQLIRVVEELMGIANDIEESEAEQDSILGSQVLPEDNADKERQGEEGEVEEDLTVPFSVVSSGSIFEHDPDPPDGNQHQFDKMWSPWEESFWSGCHNLSQLSAINDNLDEIPDKSSQPPNKQINLDFVDGVFDSSSSDNDDCSSNFLRTPPRKIIKAATSPDNERYQPLNIYVQRSPTCETKSTPKKQQITPIKQSPKSSKNIANFNNTILMKELQKNASQLNEKLRSPKSSSSSNTSSSSSGSLNSSRTLFTSQNSRKGFNLPDAEPISENLFEKSCSSNVHKSVCLSLTDKINKILKNSELQTASISSELHTSETVLTDNIIDNSCVGSTRELDVCIEKSSDNLGGLINSTDHSQIAMNNDPTLKRICTVSTENILDLAQTIPLENKLKHCQESSVKTIDLTEENYEAGWNNKVVLNRPIDSHVSSPSSSCNNNPSCISAGNVDLCRVLSNQVQVVTSSSSGSSLDSDELPSDERNKQQKPVESKRTSTGKRKKSKNLRIQVLSNFTGPKTRQFYSRQRKVDQVSSVPLLNEKKADHIVQDLVKTKHNSSHVRKTLFPNSDETKSSCDERIVNTQESGNSVQKSDINVLTSKLPDITAQISDVKVPISQSNLSIEKTFQPFKNSGSDEPFDSENKISSLNTQVSKKEMPLNLQAFEDAMLLSSQVSVEVMPLSSQSSGEAMPLSSQISEDAFPLNSQSSDHSIQLSSQSLEPSSSIFIQNDEHYLSQPHKLNNVNDSFDLTIHDQNEGIVSFYDKTINFTDKSVSKHPISSGIFSVSYNPPSRNDVLNNMIEFGLSLESGLTPFYSNPRDHATSKEVGVESIKLPSHRISDLEQFTGAVGNPLNETRKIIFDNLLGTSFVETLSKVPSLNSHSQIIFTPVKVPPTRKDAEIWKKKSKCKIIEEEQVEEDVKGILEMAIFGFSPNHSQSLSQSLTTCSPISTQHSITDQNCNKAVHSTPAVAQKTIFSPSVTPIASLPKVVRESSLPIIQENEEMLPISACSSQSKSSLKTQLELNSGVCDINNATPQNSGMFKMEFQNLQDAHSVSLHRHITLLVAEVHCQTRAQLNPDPEYDSISAIFYCMHNDVPPDSIKPRLVTGCLLVSEATEPHRRYSTECRVTPVPSELDLIQKFISLVREWDPDIIAGYETEMLSWGYIIQRGYVLGLNLAVDLSRVNIPPLYQPDVNFARGLEVKLAGRIALNIWRLMRHEVALTSYSFENIMYHILHTRVPKFSFKTLTLWWTHCNPHCREFTIKYYLTKVIGITQILDQLDFIGSTSELASLFGIQFYEVLSRGSQFRVESMMIRLARLQNFVSVSPSIKQRALMRAPACIPLVMEPKSRFYGDPVIVLDFQSLYPSMMIAYNYCFSTCLGRIEHILQNERFEFGCTELKIPLKQLNELKDKIHVSPVGIAFVTPDVRKGIISKMVEEILETRLMVKKSMKDHKNDKLLQRVLHARQLGLKLIANVTYGYTSANFSGRMPSVEVADSIVSKGRETLERVIEMVNSHPSWGSRVVYGDTDSVFVLCPGKTRQEAFLIGQEIADAATKNNPKPVKLKLEKVYQPCILQTKKRYVGFMYESPDQLEPTYDAKGIETVRRDGCPAVSKILEKSLKILFKTKDVSQVKDYVCNQMKKIFTGKINIQDVTFAREFRGIFGYKPGACVPALKIAREILQTDRRGEPRPGERVAYVVVCGPPGVPLIRLTVQPQNLIDDPSLRINAEYYILKAILPPLDRCFTLIGANVFSWYQDFPKRYLCQVGRNRLDVGGKRSTISQYFATIKCVLCGEMTVDGICSSCQRLPHIIVAGLAEKSANLEYRHSSLLKLCESCCERKEGLNCISLDCPVLYRRVQASRDLSHIDFYKELSEKFVPELF